MDMTSARAWDPSTLRRTRVQIRGVSDLIVHAWDRRRSIATTADGWESAKYLDDQGRDCILAVALKYAMMKAGLEIGGPRARRAVLVGLFIHGERIPIEYDECVMREDVVMLNGRVADLRYRPGYRNWGATFEVTWDSERLSARDVLNLVRVAGDTVGIHEWRPERGGQFGRFTLVSAHDAPRFAAPTAVRATPTKNP